VQNKLLGFFSLSFFPQLNNYSRNFRNGPKKKKKQNKKQNNHQEDAGMIKRYGNMYNKFIKHCKTSFSSPPFWGEKYLGMLFN
jgi:hypothetical protein